jgi:hypothetical protein
VSRNFELVAPNSVAGPRTVPAEIVDDVNDMWKVIQENPGLHIRVPFENEKDAKAWLANAQAYAKGQGLNLRKVRDDSLPAEYLRIHIETAEDRAKRLAEAKANAERLAAQKAAGVPVKRGRKAKTDK